MTFQQHNNPLKVRFCAMPAICFFPCNLMWGLLDFRISILSVPAGQCRCSGCACSAQHQCPCSAQRPVSLQCLTPECPCSGQTAAVPNPRMSLLQTYQRVSLLRCPTPTPVSLQCPTAEASCGTADTSANVCVWIYTVNVYIRVYMYIYIYMYVYACICSRPSVWGC